MDKNFLDEYFLELNNKIHNKQFLNSLQEKIYEIDKVQLENLIKEYF